MSKEEIMPQVRWIHEDDSSNTRHLYDDERRHHCETGPAWLEPGVMAKYYIHGKLHRTDGPAEVFRSSIWNNDTWYLNGVGVEWQDVAKWNWENGNEEMALKITRICSSGSIWPEFSEDDSK